MSQPPARHCTRLTLGILSALLLILGPDSGPAQVQSRITGTVTDESHSLVPKALVELANIATGAVYATETNEFGIFVLPTLPNGDYELLCRHAGFKTFVRKGLILEIGFSRTVDVELSLGEPGETITVEGDPPLVESESGTFGQPIEASNVDNLVIHFTLVMNQAILGLALLAAKTESVERRFSKTSGGVH